MIDADELYGELKSDFERLSSPLFEFAEQQVRKRGAFLPFGASLRRSGEIGFEAASTGEEVESGTEVLPILHEGLRASVAQGRVSAVAVCEWVKITPEGGKQTDAMKVLVEHECGLTIAFYVPNHKRMFGGWNFEAMFAQPAEPEVRPWEGQPRHITSACS
jgi:hypothetical protein